LQLSTNSHILYISAHICDSITSTWYKFNDEVVEKMEGKNLQLGTEEDVDGKSQGIEVFFLVVVVVVVLVLVVVVV
jgi:hypothetical protein